MSSFSAQVVSYISQGNDNIIPHLRVVKINSNDFDSLVQEINDATARLADFENVPTHAIQQLENFTTGTIDTTNWIRLADIDQPLSISSDVKFNSIDVTTTVDGVDLSTFKADYDSKVDQAVTTTSTPTFASVNVSGTVDGVDLSTFKADYDSKIDQAVMTTSTPTFDSLILTGGDIKCNTLYVKDQNGTHTFLRTTGTTLHMGDGYDPTSYASNQITMPFDTTRNHLSFIRSGYSVLAMGFFNGTNTFFITPSSGFTNSPTNGLFFDPTFKYGINKQTPTEALDVSGNIAVSGTVDGVDLGAFKADYDAKIDQALTTTSSPTFANINVSGNVDGVDVSQLNTQVQDHETRISNLEPDSHTHDQSLNTTDRPSFAGLDLTSFMRTTGGGEHRFGDGTTYFYINCEDLYDQTRIGSWKTNGMRKLILNEFVSIIDDGTNRYMGVNTTAPQYMLDVAGHIRTTQNLFCTRIEARDGGESQIFNGTTYFYINPEPTYNRVRIGAWDTAAGTSKDLILNGYFKLDSSGVHTGADIYMDGAIRGDSQNYQNADGSVTFMRLYDDTVRLGAGYDPARYGRVQITMPANTTRNHMSFIRSGNSVTTMGFLNNQSIFFISPSSTADSNSPTNGVFFHHQFRYGFNNTNPTEVIDVNGNIAVSGTVDGVDLFTFKSDYDSKGFAEGYITASAQITERKHGGTSSYIVNNVVSYYTLKQGKRYHFWGTFDLNNTPYDETSFKISIDPPGGVTLSDVSGTTYGKHYDNTTFDYSTSNAYDMNGFITKGSNKIDMYYERTNYIPAGIKYLCHFTGGFSIV